jgi:predicted permease
MALMGAVLGGVIAVWGTNALRAVPFPSGLPIRFQTGVDGIGLAFAVVLGVACGLAFGVAPALQLARLDPQRALRPGATSEGRNRVRGALVAFEVALALVVLVAAGLFWRRLGDARETDPGFRREGVLLASYDLTGRGQDTAYPREFARRLLERLRALPGVEAASIAMMVPLDVHGMPTRSFALEGRSRGDAGEDQALFNVVTPGYFRTMGIPLQAGTDFADLGDAAAAPQAVVNAAFVRRFIGDDEPIGRRIRVGRRSFVIVGVVRNSLYSSFAEGPTPIIHYSYRDRPRTSGEIHLRTRAGAEAALAVEMRRAIREIVFQRIPARMFVVLGPLLLVLTAIGIYAVVAYTVARRTTEIGVRLALGATGRRVVRHMVGDILRVVGAGAAAGWVVALVVELHIARGRPVDVPVLLGVPAVLLLVAALASWLPARRATMVDPVVALRQE